MILLMGCLHSFHLKGADKPSFRAIYHLREIMVLVKQKEQLSSVHLFVEMMILMDYLKMVTFDWL